MNRLNHRVIQMNRWNDLINLNLSVLNEQIILVHSIHESEELINVIWMVGINLNESCKSEFD